MLRTWIHSTLLPQGYQGNPDNVACDIFWNSFRKCERPTPFPRKFWSYPFAGLEMEGNPARSSSEWWLVGLLSPSLTQHHVVEAWKHSQSQHQDKYSAFPFTPHFSFLFYQAVCFPVDLSAYVPAYDRQLFLEGQEKEKKKSWGWSCDTGLSVPSIAKVNPTLSNSFIP